MLDGPMESGQVEEIELYDGLLSSCVIVCLFQEAKKSARVAGRKTTEM
jgi:hypothetical protein